MTLLDVAVPFILLLGGLIFFHELGHFMVAKAFGVKVEKFSIGFGPALVKRTVGETEYLIALLPLGGYVKMLGEIPGEELDEAERERAFNTQAVWKRVGIASAGPGMNLLLPIVVLALVYMVGVPTPTTLIGGVVPDSPGAEAGLVPGDRITAVDGRDVWRWRDLTQQIAFAGEGPLALEVEREGETRRVELTPRLEQGRPVIGIDHSPPAPLIATTSREAPAYRAGLRTGDEIVSVDGAPVSDWYGLMHALAAAGPHVQLEATRALGSGTERVRVELVAGADRSPEALGVRVADSEVRLVEPGSPADQAGLEPGDLILTAHGQELASFASFAETIRTGDGAPLPITVLRSGQILDLDLVPEPRPIELDGELIEVWAIGVHGGPRLRPGEIVDDVVRNPLLALWVGTERTGEIFSTTLLGIAKLITAEVSLNNVAGPIGIGKIAADSYEESWFQFFWVMAVISVNLAILNLLPIPILDGGQIVFALAEGIKGAPLSLRVREVAQQVGLSLLILLMGFAFWNDLSRYWSRILGFFENLV